MSQRTARPFRHGGYCARSAQMRSTPRKQFKDLVLEEMSRMWEADPRTRELPDSIKRTHIHLGMEGPAFDIAAQKIKEQWLEQGIWKTSWNVIDGGPHALEVWKHEQTLGFHDENANEDEDDDDNEGLTDPETLSQQYDARKTEEELAHDREASRPVHQFIYQISQERQRLSEKHGDYCWRQFPDLNTKAYDIVKKSWISREIWDDKWGVLPGMFWKHEVVVNDWNSGDSGEEHEDEYGDNAEDGIEDEDLNDTWDVAETDEEDAQLPDRRESYRMLEEPTTLELKGERKFKRQRIAA
ncbi:hypothetical protein F5Y18DRAFT_426028 [Xylariaceae sp. FL1019]|nr:hypothetical protein F5Y18DRAFT_426028 [Xylariaceae sp. FL1019]